MLPGVVHLKDDDDVRAYIVEALRDLDYDVLEAADAPSALAIVERRSGNIDLLLTDVVMPRMSGRELARRLADSRPDMKVLYVSGYTDDAIVRHGILDPGVIFLQKPFSPDVLARKVAETLSMGSA